MTTRGALKTEILDDILRSGTAWSNRVGNAINEAIAFYQPRRFYFNESRSITFDTVASQASYGFGTDIATEFYKIDGVFITDGDTEYEVERASYLSLEALNDATEARPEEYAYIAQALRFYRTPDAAYTVRLAGHIKLAAPANDAEEDNGWMVHGYQLIRARAIKQLAMFKLDADGGELAQRMNLAEISALKAIESASGAKTGTGYIIPTEF